MKLFQSLSESEMEIMRVIWKADAPMTTAQLLDLFAHKGWKVQTMSTFLARLVEKGVLHAEKHGKANTYTPAVSEQGYHQMEAQHVIDSMYHGSVLDFLAAFYGGEGISKKDVDALRQWFDKEAGL